MVQTLNLKNKTLAITRPREQAEELGKIIQQNGGTPFYIPTVEIRQTSDFSSVRKFVNELCEVKIDFVVLMSVNGVECLFEVARILGLQQKLIDGLKKTKILAVGPATAHHLQTRQVHVDFVPSKYTSNGVIETLSQLGVSGKSIRIPRTSAASHVLLDELVDMGADVQEIYVYQSTIAHNSDLEEKFLKELANGKIDALIFGSSLCVKNLFKMLEDRLTKKELCKQLNEKVTIVAIGPVTATTLTEFDVEVDVMPQKHLFEEALIALEKFWKKRKV